MARYKYCWAKRLNFGIRVTYLSLLSAYDLSDERMDELWKEIEDEYSAPYRCYHTLAHLSHLSSELEKVAVYIRNYEAVWFALFYHDFVYEICGTHNEEKSAALASVRLSEIGVRAEQREKVKQLILATKKHEAASDGDTNYFTDADLSILGGNPANYTRYLVDLRNEYHVHSDAEFAEGRKREMRKLLAMPRIFKTEHFFNLYEKSARENILNEIAGYA